ncbi:unnamed protein product [Cladocopium goreaui]|uniref:ATP-dependent RNA helicase HrpB n=1 Tax=Cladocopium goreaui TaxID=2562237 RepID=A0A9P1DLG5_9DINO|nr:unnamed protein product [Cladocopium goreaui]
MEAPTGAGKTTVVPLALLDGGMVDGKVIVLQPRRITCISVARRMAELWGESIGETIGYRIRHEAIVSNRTRIEVVTEGVLLRLLGQNPDLEGIGCICFDEFHERSIESDLAFALCLHLKRQRRLAARLVIMSATFGTLAEQVSGLLGNARTIISEGRCFPVQVLYTGALRLTDWEPQGPRRFADLVATQVKSAMEEHEGDVLVFVPGEREIMYVWIALNNMGVGDGERPKNLVPWAHRLIDDSKVDLSKKIQVSPLYGTMETHEQDSVLKAREGDFGNAYCRVFLDSVGNLGPSFYVFHTARSITATTMKFLQACSERQDGSIFRVNDRGERSLSQHEVSQVSQNRVSKRDSFGMCVVRDDTNWDDGVTANQAPELKWSDAQLVVARYDEDLRWLDALPGTQPGP